MNVLKDYYRFLLVLPGLLLNQTYVFADPNQSEAATDSSSITAPDNSNLQIAAAIGSSVTSKKPVVNRPSPEIIFDDVNNLRLLELHIGPYNLQDLVAAYQFRDMVMVPVGSLAELIDLAVTVDRGNNTASGFVFREDRTFSLDVERSEVIINGKLSKFDPERIAVRELDDIYVDSRLLSKWLPLNIEVDLFQSRLNIISDEPIPFEKRKMREEKIKYAKSRLGRSDRGYPKLVDPPLNWSYPLIDQTVRLGVIRNSDEKFDSTFGYTTFATADLFEMESSWFLSGTEHDLFDETRVVFSKKDPNASLLGTAKATELSFGHIVEPSFDHVTRTGTPQLGILVSSYPLKRQLEYDRHQFIGDLQPGWEVELYRNNALLDYRVAGVDGQYRFEDVPLLFGNNTFRLVFYGPQGQQREETYTFNLDSSLTKPGEYYFRATVMEDEDKDDGERFVINSDIGINKNSIATTLTARKPL